MSSSKGPQDASLSAASFLASISAESHTSFGSTGPSDSATSAPTLPISAKVALIDAQIDALETHIEHAVTTNAAQLRARAASARAVDRDLNHLWRSINQTSSRLVNVGPHLAPVASEYHEALAQSSKQGLVIAVLSDLLTATRHLEQLEKLGQQSDLNELQAELPKVSQLMQPFQSHHALQSIPAVVELKARFDRLENKCKTLDSTVPRALLTTHATQQTATRASLATGSRDHPDSTDVEPVLSPALKVLDKARALIVARGSQSGWKEFRIELDAPAPPPAVELQAPAESSRSSLEAYPERLLREEVAMEPTSLTRNSSTSSNTTARARHKPKLGARVLRPQDQLGSGPFEAEDDGDGWGLDDDEEPIAPPVVDASNHPDHTSHSLPATAPLSHPNIAALARESRYSSPSGSVSMHHSMSSSSSQRSVFAVQEAENVPANDGDDAWGLGDEDDQKAEADAWDLDEDDIPQQLPPSPQKDNATAKAGLALPPPARPAHARVRSTIVVAGDAWDLDDEELPQQSPLTPRKAETSASVLADPPHAPAPTAISDAKDAWELDEEPSKETILPSPKKSRFPEQTRAILPASTEPVQAPVASVVSAQDDGWGLEEGADVSTDDPWQTHTSRAQDAAHLAASADRTPIDDDPRETKNRAELNTPTAPPTSQTSHAADAVPSSLPSSAMPVHMDTLVQEEVEGLQSTAEVPSQASSKGRGGHAVPADRANTQGKPEEVLPTADAALPVHFGQAESAHKQSGKRQTAEEPVPRSEKTHPPEDEADVPGPEEDAWEFEEGSSASETDRAELAPMSAVQKAESAPMALGDASSKSIPSVPAPVNALQPVKGATHSMDADEREPESPASSNGWGSFSDGDSEEVADATASNQAVAAAGTGNAAAAATRALPATNWAHTSSSTPKGGRAAEPQPQPQAARIFKEECTISQRSLDLVHLADSTMDSVFSLLEGEGQSEASIDDAEALGGAVFKMFELHRALMPVAHGVVLQDVPALAMQFFNDCEYLARELARLAAEKGESISQAWMRRDADAGKRWKSKELPKLEQEVCLTRALGQRWFEAQMAAQTKILLDTLMEADGFARMFDSGRFGRCERCVKQVVQTLEQLAKAWQRVLVASRYHAAMGRLVDLVLQKMLHDVLDLEDIGESESEKLASLIKTLGTLESLFSAEPGSDTSTAPLWVPSWFKASYLIEILTGSLVDIEFLAFEANALVDYSRKELTGLIKALFADTPNRTKLLRRIETASVDVLAH